MKITLTFLAIVLFAPLALARPATIPRARAAETEPKGKSYHYHSKGKSYH
jgi:hypothetical protein